ncbi:hypothetical protein VN97_g209 [Penicillium thymicola]|uniref:Uncharacterized protein n=1 Tax=Penicillium thymicola TaxID=293382 RepID=A0AAI9XDZ9_PENTH|nr:hypothetical protein VN97_g209 [Penicillium thymicola]
MMKIEGHQKVVVNLSGLVSLRTEIYSVSLTLSALIKAATAKIGKTHLAEESSTYSYLGICCMRPCSYLGVCRTNQEARIGDHPVRPSNPTPDVTAADAGMVLRSHS